MFSWLYVLLLLCPIKVISLSKELLKTLSLTIFGKNFKLTSLFFTSSAIICPLTVSPSERMDTIWINCCTQQYLQYLYVFMDLLNNPQLSYKP